jgi:hypothetical protein
MVMVMVMMIAMAADDEGDNNDDGDDNDDDDDDGDEDDENDEDEVKVGYPKVDLSAVLWENPSWELSGKKTTPARVPTECQQGS